MKFNPGESFKVVSGVSYSRDTAKKQVKETKPNTDGEIRRNKVEQTKVPKGSKPKRKAGGKGPKGGKV